MVFFLRTLSLSKGKEIVLRVLAVCFWVLLISLFLWSPKVKKIFRKEKSLSLYVFPKLINAKYLTKFEKETGIKLYINYYENNDELLVKMKKTSGKGYDIILPSDYAVEILKQEGLLKKLDKSKLTFFKNLDPKFLGQYFDPHNNYSIPYSWETYKIGFNKNFFKDNNLNSSWDLIFKDDPSVRCVIMANNAREVILMAAFYLFGSIDNLDAEKIQKIKELLIKQKKWVEVYSDLRSDYLLSSETCPLAVGTSGEIWKATRFDENLGYVVPKEGTFMLIDSIAVSAASKKDDLIYKFLNFLYQKESVDYHVNRYSLFPVVKGAKIDAYCKETIDKIFKTAKKIEFFRSVLSEDQLNEIWIDLKVR